MHHSAGCAALRGCVDEGGGSKGGLREEAGGGSWGTAHGAVAACLCNAAVKWGTVAGCVRVSAGHVRQPGREGTGERAERRGAG